MKNNRFYLIVLLLLLPFSITTDSEYKESLEDYDGDGLPDAYELANDNDPYDRNDITKDADSDGLTIQEEFIHGTSDQNPDTDFDTLPDAWEIAQGRNPLLADYQISTGAESSCALTDNGIVCWGKDNGSLNVPELYNPTAVAVGSTFACALENSEEICWGDNQESLIGKPSLNESACLIKESGIVCQNEVTFGSPPLIENPAQVSAGESSACALAPDGVTCWGYNINGENDVPALVIDPDGDGYTNQGGVDAFPLDPTRWMEEITSIEVNQTGDLDSPLTYADSGRAIAGVKVVMTESDGTVTVLVTNSNGQITLPSTANTFTLSASLAEAGKDPITLVDALQIIQYAGELRTLTADQIKAADVNNDGEVDVLDALWILQHLGELRTLDSNLIFLDTNTGKPLSETTFSSGDAINISTIRTGDVDQDFDPFLITDHAPLLTGQTTLVMDENETSVSTLVGSDADGDTLTYSITGGVDQSLFTINATTGVLSFKASPDYEDPSDSGGNNLYDIEVSVSDGTNTTTQALEVSVTDVANDGYVSPVITNLASSISVEENQTSVVTVTATNPNGDTLTYTLGGADATSLSINSSSGVITFNSAPDYETKTSYLLIVNVSDNITIVSQALTINVINVNEFSPVIASSDTFSAAENQTTVGTVTASDVESSSLTFSISGSDASFFSINSSSGVITFNSAPDYEYRSFYLITVSVSDSDNNTTTQVLRVNITNVNDNNPAITSDLSFSAAENQTSVGTVTATDTDGDSLTYSLSGTDASSFNINSSSGVITFNSAPDYETKSSYSITVSVSDGSNTNTQSVTVGVSDVDETGSPPNFTSAATFSAAENQTAVGTVTASDAETSSLTFSISGTDASSFNINSSSGVITFKSAPDYETKSSYSITVSANDSDNNTTTQAVTINVTNLNDNDPSITSDSSFTAAENQTAVGTVTATDADGGSLTYSLSGTDASSFTINSSSGVITFNSAPDYEIKSSYSITVTASDGSLSSAQNIQIVINNVVEAIIFENQSFTVVEGNTSVGTIIFSDPDNQFISFSASDGDAGRFNVDPYTGVISFIRAPDYENPKDEDQNNKNEFVVSMLTQGSGFGGSERPTAEITVNVTDDNLFNPTLVGDVINGPSGNFGQSVDLDSNGTSLVVGTPGSDSSLGSVLVYSFDGSSWSQKGDTILGEGNGDGYDSWGEAVSINSDGSVIAAAAKNNDSPPLYNTGHVRIFEWSNNNWAQKGSDIDGVMRSQNMGRKEGGRAIDLTDDGNTVVIGSALYGYGNPNRNGALEVWEFVNNAWALKGSKIIGNTNTTSNPERVGNSVSINGAGNIIAYGAPGWEDPYTLSGQVKIFEWDGSDWLQKGSNINGSGLGQLGTDVRLNELGNKIVILGRNHAEVWELSGNTLSQLGSDINETCESGSFFQGSVDISDDGDFIVVSAPGCDGGVVFTYKWNGLNWSQQIENIYKPSTNDGNFGQSISLTGDEKRIAVGIINSASVRVYKTSEE